MEDDSDINNSGKSSGGSSSNNATNSNGEQLLYVSEATTLDASGNPGVFTGSILPSCGGLPHGDEGVFCYTGAVTQTPIHKYEGSWVRGEWHGHGKCTMRNGDVYEGNHEYGQRQGTGKYIWKVTKTTNNAISAATSAATSTATATADTSATENQLSSEPRVYEGDFVQNQRHGQALYRWGNLSHYKGTFVNGQRQGHGVYVHRGANLEYNGEWQNSKYHGQGVLSYPCRRCVGTDLMTNQKHIVLAMYKGSWNMGQRHGYGIETSGDGAIRHDGMWNHDTPMVLQNAGSFDKSGSLSSGDGSGGEDERSAAAAVAALNNTKSKKAASNTATNNSNATQKATNKGQTVSKTASVPNTIVVNQEICYDARGYRGLYKGILFNALPQGVGTMSYTLDDTYKTLLDVTGRGGDNPVLEYEGFWEDGKFHGYGRMKMKNGDKYVGNFEDNQRHGQDGEYWYADGRHYKGDWHFGIRQGSGRFLYPDTGDLYQGEFVNGQRQGQGKFTFGNDGTSYDGEWFEGEYHGFGTLISDTGAVYVGQFEHGEFNGQGKQMDSSGKTTYEGEFVQGLPKPQFEKNKANQTLFSKMAEALASPATAKRKTVQLGGSRNSSAVDIGDTTPVPESVSAKSARPILTNQITGSGASTSSLLSNLMAPSLFGDDTKSKNKQQQVVDKEDDKCKAVVDQVVWDGQNNAGRFTGILHVPTQKPHGVGRMVYKDGNRIYEGFWAMGHRQGHGRCMFVEMGDFHEGQYHANLRHGPGKYMWKDGRRFVGEYHHDERHGPGKFMYPSGDIYEGMFEHGQRSGQGVFTFGAGGSCLYRGSWANGVYHGSGTLVWTQTIKTSVSASMVRLQKQDITTVRTTKHKYQGEFRDGAFHGMGTEFEITETQQKKSQQQQSQSLSSSSHHRQKPAGEERLVRKGIWESGEYVGEALVDDVGGGDSSNGSNNEDQKVMAENGGDASNPVIEEEPRSPLSTDGEWEKVTTATTATTSDNESTKNAAKKSEKEVSGANLPSEDLLDATKNLNISKDDSFLPRVPSGASLDCGDLDSTSKAGEKLRPVKTFGKRSMSAPPRQNPNMALPQRTIPKECCSGAEQTYEDERGAWQSTLDMDVAQD